MKVVKSDWRRKFSEEKIEALLRIKVEGPKIEEFIKEHSSDAVVFWWDAKERSKGANGKKKKKKKKCKDCSTKTNRLNIANKFIYSFLERSSDECVGHVI